MLRFWLHTVEGVFEFSTRHLTLGRDRRKSGFVLPDLSVMPVHAVLSVHDDRLYIEKFEYDALTFLNRSPIQGRMEVFDGDAIDIGPWTLILRSPHLERRPSGGFSLEGRDATPSDATMIKTVKVSQLPKPLPPPDDSTGSFII